MIKFLSIGDLGNFAQIFANFFVLEMSKSSDRNILLKTTGNTHQICGFFLTKMFD